MTSYDREKYLANREAVIARARKWALENPERRKEIVRKANQKAKDKRAAWHQAKQFGLLIERECCARCGTGDGGKRGLVVHHIDGCNGKRGQPLNNDPGNLVVLCRSCHAVVHRADGIREVVSP